ncbi:haloacid dehalogenase type II [Roseomonas sp. BN140053]|uniref:haloacid dehalogenase type II n=1 Tax=Roseomonas sp. BN140053 TaxID=3391898 RepID=UPI0039E76B9C
MTLHPAPEALLFDVFGTCVDWRSSIAAEGERLGARLGLGAVDWFAFADAWRARYQPQMETVRSGRRPWTKLPVLNREALDEVLPAFGLDALPLAERDAFNHVWTRLTPWPDVVPALGRLKRRFILAPNSNADIASGVRLARHAGLPWDTILGAEIGQGFKPQPQVYLRSVAALELDPAAVVMVAAHNGDLRAAAALGLRTAFVPRPTEHGPQQRSDLHPDGDFTLVARDFTDLADQLLAT